MKPKHKKTPPIITKIDMNKLMHQCNNPKLINSIASVQENYNILSGNSMSYKSMTDRSTKPHF
jgi:hypothetical protein